MMLLPETKGRERNLKKKQSQNQTSKEKNNKQTQGKALEIVDHRKKKGRNCNG